MAEKKASKVKGGWARRPKGGGVKACAVSECKRPYRAKGYCYFHYKKWRHGELPHSRYKTGSKAEGRKRVSKHGICEQHLGEGAAKKPAETAAAPAPVPAPAA